MTFRERRVAIPEHVWSRDAGEKVVLLDLQADRFVLLEGIEASIWRFLLEQPGMESTVNDMLAALQTEHDLQADGLWAYLERLLRAGLLELCP